MSDSDDDDKWCRLCRRDDPTVRLRKWKCADRCNCSDEYEWCDTCAKQAGLE